MIEESQLAQAILGAGVAEVQNRVYLGRELRNLIESYPANCLIKPDGSVTASLFGGPYPWFFIRDAGEMNSAIVSAWDDFDNCDYSLDQVGTSLKYFLRFIEREDDPARGIYKGELPHEVGTVAQGFPFLQDPDGFGRRFGSVDGQGLMLNAINDYLRVFARKATPEEYREVEESFSEATELLVTWTLNNLKRHGGLIAYDTEVSGTWQDGAKAVLTDLGQEPDRPVYPVLEQAVYWKALLSSADRLEWTARGDETKLELARKARKAAEVLKSKFNDPEKGFTFNGTKGVVVARALFGPGLEKIHSGNIDVLQALSYTFGGETILNDSGLIVPIVRRVMGELMTKDDVLRTQAEGAPFKEGLEYHGPQSFWPFANLIVVRGLTKLAPIVGKIDPALAEELYEYADGIAAGVARVLLKFGSFIESANWDKDGLLKRYFETRSDGTMFTSAENQSWTLAWAIWLASFLLNQNDAKNQNIERNPTAIPVVASLAV